MSDHSYAQTYNDRLLKNIRVKCVERNTSIPKIEKALGYGNGSISGWVKAKRLAPMDRVNAIAAHLKCDVSELTGEGTKNPAPTNGDGWSIAQKELSSLIPDLTPEEAAVLLAAARAQVAARQGRDSD